MISPQDKLSELQIVPQWTNIETSTLNQKQQEPVTFESMNYDTDLFINGPESDELLRALDPSLI